jgi:aspartate aminotransferase-like enzyme
VSVPVDRALLDPPPLTAPRFAAIEDRAKRLLGLERDLVVLQAEAILALEAAARGLGAPGRTCLNIVTGPYGPHVGHWLRQAGSTVVELAVGLDRAVRPEEVEAALAADPEIALVVAVHGETATGVLNPLDAVCAIAREHGALTFVDAVASCGAHPVDVEGLDLDVCVYGPQKGLGGPAGVCPVSVSRRAWRALEEGPAPWRGSSLSLLDWKEHWLDRERAALPGTPSPLEMYALESACVRLADEGLEAVFARHARAAAATRAGIEAMGLVPWVADPRETLGLCTTVRVPAGVDPAPVPALARERFGAPLLAGAGPLAAQLIRIDHLGSGAAPPTVFTALAGLGGALRAGGASVDVGAGLAAAIEAYT